MDRVDRNVCNAHAFVLITNQHFQSGEHPKVHSSIPELSPWLVPTRQIQSHHKGVRRTCEATSWEGTGDGAGEDRVPGFPTDGSSVGGSELWNFWVAERGEEQSQNWCIMEIYEFYLTFTFVYCIHFLQNHCLSLWFQFDVTKWELISWHYFWLCSWLKDHSVNLCTVQITELSTVCR